MNNDPVLSNKEQDPLVAAQNARRVATNLLVLLDIGLFPGRHSLGVEECKGFVKAIADNAEQQLTPKIVPASV